MPRDRLTVTVTETLRVNRPREVVFDYTQDYAHRSEWDASIKDPQVLSEDPRAVRVTVPGLGQFTVTYRLFRRPERTSAAFTDISSGWISGGGGSWDYAAAADGTATDWTETNTIELKPTLAGRILKPLMAWNLRRSRRKAMGRAKEILEST